MGKYNDKTDNQLDFYAYTLIGIMKKAMNRKTDDLFRICDFNLIKLNLIDTAIGSLSVKTLQDLLIYIVVCYQKFIKNSGKDYVTYGDMRLYFRIGVVNSYGKIFRETNRL